MAVHVQGYPSLAAMVDAQERIISLLEAALSEQRVQTEVLAAGLAVRDDIETLRRDVDANDPRAS